MTQRILAIAVAMYASTALAAPPAVPEFVKPYPGSKPYGQPEQKDFDEIDFAVARVSDAPPNKAWTRVQGKVTQLAYSNPEGRSVLEIYRNYEQALLSAGFQKVFACGDLAECGSVVLVPSWRVGSTQFQVNSGGRYLTAKKELPEGNLWVSVLVTGSSPLTTSIHVVQEKPMETGLVTLDAAALKSALERDGHVAVYGILFETGKADLKPSSAPALEEIRKLLEANKALFIYVVGHTDDVGDQTANLDLSRRRAQTVVRELTSKYRIPASRLRAEGVGPFVAIASNRNEAGRAKNRRVELVEGH